MLLALLLSIENEHVASIPSQSAPNRIALLKLLSIRHSMPRILNEQVAILMRMRTANLRHVSNYVFFFLLPSPCNPIEDACQPGSRQCGHGRGATPIATVPLEFGIFSMKTSKYARPCSGSSGKSSCAVTSTYLCCTRSKRVLGLKIRVGESSPVAVTRVPSTVSHFFLPRKAASLARVVFERKCCAAR